MNAKLLMGRGDAALKQKEGYRWFILSACFLIMAVAFSIVNSIHSIFIAPVTEAKGFSIGAFSFLFTIGGITTAVAAPLVGKLIEIINIKLIMSLGVLCAGLGFATFGYAKSLLSFYLIEILVAAGISALTNVPVSTLISLWFPDRKGTALGIVFAGIGTGTFFWMQVVSRLLTEKGYSFAYKSLGIILVILLLPTVLFIIKLPPNSQVGKKSPENKSIKGRGALIVLRSPAFILFSSAMLLLGLAVSGTKIHTQPFLVTTGHSLSYNANVGSTQAFFSLIGNLVGGYVFDKLPLRVTVAIFSFFSLGAYASLIFVSLRGLAFAFAALFGLFLCLAALLPAYAVGELFNGESYAVTLGLVNMVFTLGSALGPLISGIIADLAGYRLVWIVYFFIIILFLALFFMSVTSSERK